MYHYLRVGLALLALAGLSACSSNNTSNNSPTTNNTNNTSCTRGTQDCACETGNLCGLDTSGVQLACVLGVCEPAPCTPGTAGCACDAGSCGDGLECSSASGVERCEVTGCAVGAEGCGCQLDRSCSGNTACVAGTCQALTCRPGDAGCACSKRYTCSSGLACDVKTGLCEDPNACRAGAQGCVCGPNDSCDAGLACDAGICKADGCVLGTEGCACLAGGCDPGLLCDAATSMCVQNAGRRGGPCRADGTCEQNARCDRSKTPAQCVYCDLGTLGCQCTADTSCNPGLSCVNGMCAGDETVFGRTPPAAPTCYTPCSRNLTAADGSTIRCQEGLIEGCLDGMRCDRGSCVPEQGGMADVCFEDNDCPTFQLCMRGYCYAECKSNSDCGDGLFCTQKVCRKPCSLTAGDCPGGQVCESEDGENGYCVAQASATGQTQATPTGGTRLSRDTFDFSNTKLSDTFILHNDTDEAITFTIRKVSHDVLFTDNTTSRVNDFEPGVSSCQGASCPLYFLELGEFGRIVSDREVKVRAPAHCEDDCPVITARVANQGAAIDAIRWRGILEVESPAGARRVNINYVSSPQGRWAGQMYYFANFETQGIDSANGQTGWLDRPDRDDVLGVSNGLIQRWGAFRNGDLTGGWKELQAVLAATQTGQWRFPNVAQSCIANDGACYLFDAGAGALPKVYVTSLSAAPIPTGVAEFPMAVNIYNPPGGAATELKGRVVSEAALQYAGDPEVRVQFAADPAAQGSCDPEVASNCVNFITGFEVDLSVGGRYIAPASGTCAPGFKLMTQPWLVPGFLKGARPGSGAFTRAFCVDTRLPFDPPATPEEEINNTNLARSNPIPNGEVLERKIEFLDGAMIDQRELFILFRERYPSLIGGEDVVAYGYMVLQRQPMEVSSIDDDGDGVPDEYKGSTPRQGLSGGTQSDQAVCSRDLLDEVLGAGVALSQQNAPTVINALIDGGQPAPSAILAYPHLGGAEEVHYLCEETGLFDGGKHNVTDWGRGAPGPNDDSCATAFNGVCEDGRSGASASSCAPATDRADCGLRYNDQRVACPTKSSVIYFTADPALLPDIHALPCQQDGSCLAQLNTWRSNGAPLLKQVAPIWRCADGGAFCDDNTLDRRHGKVFYKSNASGVLFLSMRAEIEEAFRYKIRFRARDGSTPGFAPTICEAFSTNTPYCYDPAKIEQIRERVDCLMEVYDRYYDSAAGAQNPRSAQLYALLEESFSVREEPNPLGGLPQTFDGFERLYAELLIMLGDGAYTAAFESRFDLAGSLAASFPGAQFEDRGIDLSGIAGFELFKLYQAVQYYDMVLDRFYASSPVIGAALASGEPSTERNFISAKTVTTYFDRLIRASTQRSRALAEIARRYQSLNRPDLANRVAQRAYTSTYLESVLLANLITSLYDASGGSDRPQLLAALERSQLRYRMALLDLVSVYETITQDINIFGFPPDYIPFPALDNAVTASAESNAFEKVLRTANAKLDVARVREQTALTTTRGYETDGASFQAELSRISTTYENQLADLCGTFQGADGLIYPSIVRYAYLDERLSVIGDPCGFSGNGQIHRALGELELQRQELRGLSRQVQNVFAQIEIERKRVSQQCKAVVTTADYNYKVGKEIRRLDFDIENMQIQSARAERLLENTAKAIEIWQCEGEECVAVGPALAKLGAMTVATEAALVYNERKARQNRRERANIELDAARWNALGQCSAAQIDSDAATANMLLGLKDLEISLQSAEYRLNLAMSEVIRLRHQAKRTALEWQDSLQLSLDVEAAKNDPNTRIYRNDSVINADLSFEDALKEAYRLTLLYEYYTSQTYAARDQLFLIRMVSAGSYNLENYIYDLANAFTTFEEEYGLPDTRVEVLSLRDDIFQIPRTDANGEALSTDQRTALMRERLADPGLLNARGYLTIPFRTNMERLSPLTRNHKILYLEANIEGSDNGDFLGRLYVRQVGTSVVRSVDDDMLYYRFPERTAVINPFFNGSRQFAQSPELYRSYRLRERPLVNTDWELVINQRDEQVNQDINLQELTDIKLYIFYNDFTVY